MVGMDLRTSMRRSSVSGDGWFIEALGAWEGGWWRNEDDSRDVEL